MKAYSQDLPKRVVEAYQRHEGSQHQVAQRFGVSLSLTPNLMRRVRRTGSVDPKPHLLLFILSSLLLFLSYGKALADTWYNTSWSFRKQIVINHTKVSGDQSNFSVLISIPSDSNLSAGAQQSGNDILFTDINANKLNHEIEYYNSSTGQLIAWVQVPALSSTTDTTMYMYYGNPSASNQQNPPGVWNNGFVSAYHMNQATGQTVLDSIGGNNGTPTGTSQATQKIDGGLTFAKGDIVSIPGSLGTPSAFTVSAWANLTSSSGENELFNVRGMHVLYEDFVFASPAGTTAYYQYGAGLFHGTTTGIKYAGTGWHYFVYVVDPAHSSQVVYVDGVQKGSSTFTDPIYWGGAGASALGNDKAGTGSGTAPFTGGLDEERFANVARSAGWVATEYNNQNSPGTFFTLGSQQSQSQPPPTPPPPTPTPSPTPVPISGWSVVNKTGLTSNWQLVNQAYTQQNFVGGGGQTLVNNQTYRLGTYMYLNSGSSLTDYTVTLNITPLLPTGGGDPGDDVGVMFRYQNDQNYYRLSFNWPMGFARLEKQVNGVFSTLAHNGRGAIVGQKQSITIEVISNKILVYQNGQPLFSASDSSLSSGTIALYCRNSTSFDSVSINTNSTAPSIIISTPVSYSVETSNNLNVSAIATNVPTGGGVQFVLDSGTAGQKSFLVSSEPYSGQFTGVSQGEHTVSALILDTNGNILASDTNVRVGVLGDYYVTVGDSITYGLYDNYSLDNSSQDGRIIAEIGYESVLNDLLTSALSFPNIVFNEGVAGDQSINALNRVGSIIERHPKANNALILLGTNDSGGSLPVPSGLGCAGSSCNGTYYQNMQTLVNTLNSNGKAPTVALIPPVNPASSSQNSIIQQYNQVIQNQLTGIKVGPDLYSFYINQLDLYFDAYHPDGLGHPISANLWSNSLLNQSGSPFVLGNLSPSYYKQNLIQSGGDAYGTKSQYYIDATYSLTSIPSELQGSGKVWIMTANGDSQNTSDSFLTFNLPQASTVYVGYDPRATSLPNWLANNFVNTGLTLGITDPVGTLNLYKASFAAGSVSLGGNMAAGAAFPSGVSGSMYVVIVKPNKCKRC